MRLRLSGVDLCDLIAACSGIEAAAVRLVAQHGTSQDFDDLESTLSEQVSLALRSRAPAMAAATFRRRVVDLTGSATLSQIAGVLQELVERHPARALRERREFDSSHYEPVLNSCRQLLQLIRARRVDAAEAHWRHHIDSVHELSLEGGGDDHID
jgi:GntR family transcriptional repressor for pyruvate dehydrogenase complex